MSRILVVDDESAARYGARRLLEGAGHEVAEAGSAEEMFQKLSRRDFDAVLLDDRMGGMSGLEALSVLGERSGAPAVVLFTAQGSERVAVEAMRRGAADYLCKPADADELVLVLERAASRQRERTELELARHEADGTRPTRDLLGDSPALVRLRRDLGQIAPSGSSVLLLGESGTGKEMAARFLHERSGRTGPFVAVNCGALPTSLIEAELFGHEKGAFTGAVTARPGRLRQAHGGTLFLDEIGDMPLEAQVRLLRVLEERIVEPVGGNQTIEVDIRVVAATHRDLGQLCSEGRFREDLFYRLNVISIAIPPLRERPGDVLLLARRFLSHYGGNRDLRFDPATEDALARWTWPGNVRELRNVVERASVLCRGNRVGPELLGLPEAAGWSPPPPNPLDAGEPQEDLLRLSPVSLELSFRDAKERLIEEFERRYVQHHLDRAGGVLAVAAKTLGMHRQSLSQKLRDLGLAGRETEP
jgi:DNA-binding NtrC family response regulator